MRESEREGGEWGERGGEREKCNYTDIDTRKTHGEHLVTYDDVR